LKDRGYDARFIFLAPPDGSELEQRLQKRGSDTAEMIRQRLEIAQKELEQAKIEGFHDVTFVNDNLEVTYKSLESYIFGDEENEESSSHGEAGKEAAGAEVDRADGDNAKGSSNDTAEAGTTIMEVDESAKIPADEDTVK
jgi:THO complex subunit 1